jgi:hypothetical protein
MQYEYKISQNLMLIFESLKKFAKSHAKKWSMNNDRNMEFLTSVTVCKSFRPVTFLDEHFCNFSTDSN